MFRFESEELKSRFNDIIEKMLDATIDCWYESYYLDEFDSIDEDDVVDVKQDSIINITLPNTESEGTDFALLEWIDLFDEAEKGNIISGYHFVGNKYHSFRVHPQNTDKFYSFLEFNKLSVLTHNINIDGREYTIKVENDITPFGVKVVLDNNYSEYLPPILDEYFIAITSSQSFQADIATQIFEVYIFEIFCAFRLDLSKSPRYDEDYINYDIDVNNVNLRALIIGNGLKEVYSLFNIASSIVDSESRILYYCKVIEFVSQTVIKSDLVNITMNKLSTRSALNPNADFVRELEQIFNNNRSYSNRDSEAYRITIKTCCDVMSIKEYAPSYMKKVNRINVETAQKEINESYEELSKAISDTRNKIAHAKTNYKMKGHECPDNEIDNFCEMLEIIAEQVIRWFIRQDEKSRIIT